MFTFLSRYPRSKMSEIDEDSLQIASNEVKNRVENHQASQKRPQSAVHMGKDNEGYGSAGKAEACSRASPYQKQGCPSSSVADVDNHSWESVFPTTQLKERNFASAMCDIRRNYETKDQGDLQEVLKSRALIYGDQLNPKWFTHGTDLGDKVKSVHMMLVL